MARKKNVPNAPRGLIRAIVGVGNANKTLARTRHNVAHLWFERLRALHGGEWAKLGRTGVHSLQLPCGTFLLRNEGSMNECGPRFARALRELNLQADDVVVAHDDKDLALGGVKVKHGGSASGHNGVKSIISSLRTDNFDRLRIGVGNTDTKEMHAAVFVLSNFEHDEHSVLEKEVFPKASRILGMSPQ